MSFQNSSGGWLSNVKANRIADLGVVFVVVIYSTESLYMPVMIVVFGIQFTGFFFLYAVKLYFHVDTRNEPRYL